MASDDPLGAHDVVTVGLDEPPSYSEAVRRAKRSRRRTTGISVPSNLDERTPLLAVAPVDHSISHIGHSRRYFSPMTQSQYWLPVFHLLIINFPFALVVWLYLFLGVLVGTTLLLTLPLGALVWWVTLVGSRFFTNTEILMQCKFHGLPRPPRRPTFHQFATVVDTESGRSIEPSFLQNTYAMFLDWEGSYLPIFHFLVIKASIALVLTPFLLAVVPLLIILILPAPLALRLVRNIGLWQAHIALEGLASGR